MGRFIKYGLSALIGRGSITTEKLADNAVTADKVDDSAFEKARRTVTVGEAIDGSTTPIPVCFGDGSIVATGASSTLTTSAGEFGRDGTQNKLSQAVQETSSIVIDRIKVHIAKLGSPTDDVKVSIQTDNAGDPTGTELASVIIPNASISGTSTEITASLSSALTLSANTKYHIVLERTDTASNTNRFTWQYGTNGYANGSSKGYNSSTLLWSNFESTTTYDFYFKLEQIASTSRVYKSDANDSVRNRFDGFVISNASSMGSTATMQFGLVVSGFSGLTQGNTYYVSNTIGTIQNSAGSTSLKVGKAISTTEILLDND